jgi:coenzyme F420-reducing hydrogenase delta subunit
MTGLITRRRLFWAFAGATGGIVIVGAGSLAACHRMTGEASLHLMPERLAETLPEVFEPERLAQHWRSAPEDWALATEILERPGLVAALRTECVATRRATVRAQFAEDFFTGDVVMADRLLVARSEYLIAALCMNVRQAV